MVTNIHVYNVIGNREDCLVNTHHCRCSGVYHLDWRVLDQVNISILDIDLRICEIKLQDFMTSALFWNWCICLHFIFMWYLLKVEIHFFQTQQVNCSHFYFTEYLLYQLWGRAFLESFENHSGSGSSNATQNGVESESEEEEGRPRTRGHGLRPLTRISVRTGAGRNRPMSQPQYLHG